MRKIVACTARLCVLLVVLATPGLAQQDETDNTGTNPINFTYDARFYSETSWLRPDDASLMTNTFEFRLPLGRDLANLTNQKEGIFNDLGSKHQIRMRFPHKSLNTVDPTTGAPVTVSGPGDLNFRWLYIPYVTDAIGIATGLEAFFPTATNDALGDGKYVLRPQVFAGFFGLFGNGSIFAPGLLYLFDVGGDENRASVNQLQMDIFFVWLLAEMRHWFTFNPQPVIDFENNKEYMIVDVEFGYMIPPLPGASIYLRPGAGVGADRPFDWTFEIGLKFIWR